MNSKLRMMTKKNQGSGHASRSIVDRIKFRVPRKQVAAAAASSSSSSSRLVSANPGEQANRCRDPCHVQLLVQNYANFKRSGTPARFMYYDDGSWLDYANEVFDSLRLGFVEGKPVVEASIDGVQKLFDFYRMLEIDSGTGVGRSVAWIDVDGKCFFPRTFVGGGGREESDDRSGSSNAEVVSTDETPEVEIANVTQDLNSGNPKIEIKIRFGGNLNSNSNKRKRPMIDSEAEEEDDADVSSSNHRCEISIKRPLTAPDFEGPRWPKVKLLKQGEKAYTIVKSLFLCGLGIVEPGATISAIHQCVRTDPLSRARYEVFQKQMEMLKSDKGEDNMAFAWHGTSAAGAASILTHGFGMPSKIFGSESYGVGVYLTPIRAPQMSAMISEVDDNGEKHVILCRVLLGNCEKVEAGSRQLYPSRPGFDTGVDDLKNPKWYVVWCAKMNTHILPECVVSYKPSPSLPGQLHEVSSTMPTSNVMIFSKLLTKLGRSLSSSKIEELQILCSTYKGGKLAKEAFMKQLRSIVGDAMLLEAFQENQGLE